MTKNINMKKEKQYELFSEGGLTYNEWLNDDDWQQQFIEWKEDGNVSKNSDGSYSTQDAGFGNKLKDMSALKKYFYNEFIEGQYDSYAGGGIIDSFIDDMVKNQIARRTLKIKDKEKFNQFMNDIKPYIDKKIVRVKVNPVNKEEVWVSLHNLDVYAGGGSTMEDKAKKQARKDIKTDLFRPQFPCESYTKPSEEWARYELPYDTKLKFDFEPDSFSAQDQRYSQYGNGGQAGRFQENLEELLKEEGWNINYYNQNIDEVPKEKATEIGVFRTEPYYESHSIKLPAKMQVTFDWIMNKINKDKVYKSFSDDFNKLLKAKGYKNINAYPTTYGIGVSTFMVKNNSETKNKIEQLLNDLDIDYTTEYSDAHYVFRYKISKSKENISKIENLKYADGGEAVKLEIGDAVIYKGESWYLKEKDGKLGIVSFKQGSWGRSYPFIALSELNQEILTDMYGNKVDIENLKYANGGQAGKKTKINKKYKYFAQHKENQKIYNGWEIVDDVESLKHYAKIDLKDNGLKPSDFNIISAETLIKKGIDPYDSDNWYKVEYSKDSSSSEKEVSKYNDDNSSFIYYHEKKGNFIVPKGQIYAWLYDEADGVADKLQSEKYDWVFYPYASESMAWQSSYIPPLQRIWTKKFQKEHKGSEHLLGVIKAYLLKDGKELYIDMMSVNPNHKKEGIMTYMINQLRKIYGLNQEQVTFSKLTREGEEFVKSETYADGGEADNWINKMVRRKNLRGSYNYYTIISYSDNYGYVLKDNKNDMNISATIKELKKDFELI